MTPRKTILRELRAAGPETYRLPSQIPGFDTNAPKYREAVNDLLKDRLISGSKDGEGNLVVAINEARAKDVDRALRIAPPALLVAVGLAAVALIALLTVA